jgi:DnaD/phage-associated family protein
MAYLPVPTTFFGTLLRDIDDLAELKVTLHCWRLIQQQKGSTRYLRRSALEHDRALLQALAGSGQWAVGSGQIKGPEGLPSSREVLSEALERACARGTFLSVEVESEGGSERCYLLNTRANQQLVVKLQAGELQLGPFSAIVSTAPPPALPRPGIYELYEQNVGLLTPLIAEELREAELEYPAEWIEEAFREAVVLNRRSWRYIHRILENWAQYGRGERGENRGYPQPPEDAGKYLQGRYGRLLRR